jgi:hypothetical protein
MANTGEQADVLRALGRFLDKQGATAVEIKNHEVFLAVSWSDASSSERRAYQERDLESLRDEARAMRKGVAGGTPAGSMGELLRTLGQDLDRDEVEVVGIVQEPDGFRVSGTRDGHYYNRMFLTAELLKESAERVLKRAPARPQASRWQDPLELIRIGAPVYTRDDHHIGRVGAIEGRSVKINAPLFRRDFWLAAQCIDCADDDGRARLVVTEAEIRMHQSRVPVG